MVISFKILDLPAMPRNRSHMLTVSNRRPMNIKTPLCREFEKDLSKRLEAFKKDFSDFKKAFNPLRHYVSAEYYIFTPEESLFTKEGYISARSVDSDAHKCFRDVLYKSIGLDDKVERQTLFFTPTSQDGKWNYVVILRLEDLGKLRGVLF